MSSPKNPPLLTLTLRDGWWEDQQGRSVEKFDSEITLRDLFAAAALAGLSANSELIRRFDGTAAQEVREAYARTAYQQADEALAARERSQEPTK